MEDFLEEFDIENQIGRTLTDEAKEGIYILREYGLNAFLELTATESDHDRCKTILDRMRISLEQIERYEDCAYIVDIVPLLN
jgi:hypothetical protein